MSQLNRVNATQEQNPTTRRQLIDDIANCSDDHFCTLKEIVVRGLPKHRTLCLIKSLEKFKYERGLAEDREIDWNEGLDLWVEEGFAQRFNELYDSEARVLELYAKVMQQRPSHAPAG